MRTITLEELLEAGCHFGHQVTRQNPKARDFIFEERDNIHIIDLGKTKEGLEEAAEYIKTLATRPDSTLVVIGSKRQAQPIIAEQVKRAKEEIAKKTLPAGKKVTDGLYSVTSRWIGGTLTNAPEVRKNYKKYKDIIAKLKDEFEKSKYTKKEVGQWEKERQKLEMYYGGIADLQVKPDALFIIDTHGEDLAVKEAARTGVTTVGIVDTNADPAPIGFPIPANDDAVGSIALITKFIIDAWIEGKEECVKIAENEAKTAEKAEKKAEVQGTTAEKTVTKETDEKPKVKKTKKESTETTVKA